MNFALSNGITRCCSQVKFDIIGHENRMICLPATNIIHISFKGSLLKKLIFPPYKDNYFRKKKSHEFPAVTQIRTVPSGIHASNKERAAGEIVIENMC